MYNELLNFSTIIVAITAIISFMAFKDRNLFTKLMFYPSGMRQPSEYYRFISSGFIHADETHLIFNMIALYSIGSFVEGMFAGMGFHFYYLFLYLSGIIVASIPAFIKHRNDPRYSAIGASGGVSAVMFSMVYLAPWQQFRIMFILPMWSILFAVLYLAYSAYMAKQQRDNIGHDAHFWGGVYGFVFTFAIDPTHGDIFLQQLLHPQF